MNYYFNNQVYSQNQYQQQNYYRNIRNQQSPNQNLNKISINQT